MHCCLAFLVNCWPVACVWRCCRGVLPFVQWSDQTINPYLATDYSIFAAKKWCFECHNTYTTMFLQWQWNKVYYSVCNNFSSPICCVGAAIKQYFYSKRCMYPTASKCNFINYTISISSNCGQRYKFLIFLRLLTPKEQKGVVKLH